MKIHKLLVVTFALLAGCTPDIAEWTPAESPKENKVDRLVFSYFFHYPAHAEHMKPEEKRKLNQFLRDHAPSPYAVNVTIQERGGHSEKRIKDVERELLKYGIPQDFITVDYDGLEPPCPAHQKHHTHKNGGDSGVELIVERYIVIPPSCANFSRQLGDAQQAYNSSNFGCAYEANLGMMVANPRDLIRGRERGAYDGKVLAAGVNRYENDKIKAILQVATTNIPQASTTSSTSGAASSAGAATGGTGN
jgi:pilus assembly protein CpaD